MTTTTRSTTGTNPIINTILVFTVGLSALEISQLIFDRENASSLTTLDFNNVLDSMFNGMSLSADTLVPFMSVLVAWIISGMIAGVRAKNGFWGAIAGFFGTLLGAGFLATLSIASNPDSLQDTETLVPFILGTGACVLACCVAAFATGNATKEKAKPAKPKPTRKAWVSSKTKEIWTCNRCGNKIPPGAFSCPTCGEPVIE